MHHFQCKVHISNAKFIIFKATGGRVNLRADREVDLLIFVIDAGDLCFV